MFKLLTGMDKINIFSKPVDSSAGTLKPGNVVTISASDNVVLPPADGYAPVYFVISDMDEPVTKAAGTVGLAYGDFRFAISADMVEDDISVINPGDAFIAGASGKLKKGTTGAIVAYAERVDAANNVIIMKTA